jgi:hypothetical protein
VSEPERFLVELKAEGPGPPAAIRLRRWLKAALRGYGLRRVRVEELPAAADSAGLVELGNGPAAAPRRGPSG